MGVSVIQGHSSNWDNLRRPTTYDLGHTAVIDGCDGEKQLRSTVVTVLVDRHIVPAQRHFPRVQ